MVEFDNRQEIVEFTENIQVLIEQSINAVASYEKFNRDFEVSVVLTDNAEIKQINKEFRNIDRETDVLSFPMLEFEEGYFEPSENEFDFEDTNPETGAVVLGDIVLSLEKAKAQSEEFNHSLEREIAFLTVHSMLHLLGYDHEEEDDKNIMRNKEEEVLIQMGLTRQ